MMVMVMVRVRVRVMVIHFPSLALFLLVLHKVKLDTMPSIILVAPVWKRRSWYPLILEMLLDIPNLLTDPHRILRMQGKPFLLSNLTLAAWRLSGMPSVCKAFRAQLQTSS